MVESRGFVVVVGEMVGHVGIVVNNVVTWEEVSGKLVKRDFEG